MAERLSALGQPFSMHYCTRSADRTAFRERICQSRFAPAVRFHFDDGGAEQKLDIPRACALRKLASPCTRAGPRASWMRCSRPRTAAAGPRSSCEQGLCGTCLTRLPEGEPDHRDLYLSPEEQAVNDSSCLVARAPRRRCWSSISDPLDQEVTFWRSGEKEPGRVQRQGRRQACELLQGLVSQTCRAHRACEEAGAAVLPAGVRNPPALAREISTEPANRWLRSVIADLFLK
jgi:hypothetical protein